MPQITESLKEAYLTLICNSLTVMLCVDFYCSSYIGNNTWMGNDGRDDDAKKAYEGVLNIEQKFGTEKRSGAKVSAFVDRIKKRMKQEPFNVDIPENRTVSYTSCKTAARVRYILCAALVIQHRKESFLERFWS